MTMKTYGWLVGITLALALAAWIVRLSIPPPGIDVVPPAVAAAPTAPAPAPKPSPPPARRGGQDLPDNSPPPFALSGYHGHRGGGDEQNRFRPWGGGWGGDSGGNETDGEGHRGGGMRGMGRGLGNIDPAVREELQELRRNNPEAFRERIQEVATEMREKRNSEESVLRDLAETLRTTKSVEARNELRAKLSAQFDQRLERDQGQMERLKAEYERLRDDVQQRRQNKDTLLDEYLDGLVTGQD